MSSVILYRTDFNQDNMPWRDFLDTSGYDTTTIEHDIDLPESITLNVTVTEANGVAV